jgi:predicted membrane channel-forming protein YqfA (hemolysin III family)
MSFLYLGIGFAFFASHYPEKLFKRSKFSKIVHLGFQSHIWWHVFVSLSGYRLYWLLYDF